MKDKRYCYTYLNTKSTNYSTFFYIPVTTWPVISPRRRFLGKAVVRCYQLEVRRLVWNPTVYSSSSLGASASFFERFGPLNVYNFHLLRSWMQLVQFFIFSFFTSCLMSSSHMFFGLPRGRVNIGLHLYTFFFTILSSGIRCKWPHLCAFMWFIVFVCLINSSNLSFFILQVPSLSL